MKTKEEILKMNAEELINSICIDRNGGKMEHQIQLAICKMIRNMYIKPNTIRIHPSDLSKLKNECGSYFDLLDTTRLLTFLGLKVIETTKIEEGKCEIYYKEIFGEDLVEEEK